MDTTKDRLIVHAATLFAKNGCKAVTMDDIANSMGMSKRTIYKYFSDKKDLLEACLLYFIELHDMDFQQILNSVENIIAAFFKLIENTSKIFFQLKFNFLNELKKYYPEIYDNTIKVSKQQFLDNTEKLLNKGVKEGIIRVEFNPLIMAILINEVSIMTLHKDIFADYGFDKKTVMDNCMHCITRGMLTEKGVQILDKHIEEYKKMRYDKTI